MNRYLSSLGFALLGAYFSSALAADATFALGAKAADMRALLSANTGPLRPASSGVPDLAPYQDFGLGLIRTHDFYGPLDMPTLYPDFTKDPKLQSSYVFTTAVGKSLDDKFTWSSDTVFSALQSAGYEAYFRIGDSYNNVKPPASDTERANWAAAAVEVLRHYREGQWSGFQSSFNYVEIGNEPDNATFWPKPATMMDFFKLYDLTAKALRAAFPTLKIGGPGLTQGACQGSAGQTWLAAFLDYVKTNTTPLDFLSWHIYSSNPDEVASCAQTIRAALDAKGLTNVQSHLSEWNTDAENKSLGPGEAVALRANGRGAAVDTASWIRLQESSVDQAFYYRVGDPVGGPASFYGLIDGSYALKKPGLAFKLWKTVSAYTQRLTTTASGSASGLFAMGAGDAKGGYALLLANTGTAAKTWTATLPDGSTLDKQAVTLYTVSDALGVTQVAAPYGEVTIPAESAQLAVFSPIGSGFAATASASGSAASLSLTVRLTPASADQGKTGNIYIGALLGGKFYLLNRGYWQAWSGGALPVWYTGTLGGTEAVLLSAADARALAGAQVYVGYGQSEADMLSNGKFRLVYTLPAK